MIGKLYQIVSAPIKNFLFWWVAGIKIGSPQKTIHIVRMDAIGDSVLFSVMLPYFRKIYPDYKIILIVDGVVKELTPWLSEHQILGKQDNGYFDEIITIDGKAYNRNFFYYYRMLKKIRMSAPQVVIQPTFSRTKKSDQITLISKEAYKIGYEGDLSNISLKVKKKYDTQYNRLIKNPTSILEVDHNKHFLNELAGSQVLSSGVPMWHISEQFLEPTKNKLKSLGVNFSKSLVAICPGSSRQVKNWPASHFILLMQKLKQTLPELQFILIGGLKEKEICSYIEQNSSVKNIYNLCAKTTLPELAKTLSLAGLYIGNNTGSLHISCAVGISAISIMNGEKGGTDEYGSRFFPYPAWKDGAQNIAVWNVNGSLVGVENVRIDDVFNNAIKILKK